MRKQAQMQTRQLNAELENVLQVRTMQKPLTGVGSVCTILPRPAIANVSSWTVRKVQ
jgi:hypothetical protein